jgi:phytoene dehydrogenase-like protein
MARVVDRFMLGPAPTLEDLREEARRQGVEATFERFAGRSYSQLLEETFPSPAARAAFAPNLDGDVHATGAPLTQAYYETQRLRTLRYQGIPEGGMGAVSHAFARAAAAAGARLRLGAEVALILVEDGVARGVELVGGERIRARLVVSNADPKRTFLRLCERAALPTGVAELVEGLDSSPGGIKIHCALRGIPDVARLTDGDDPRGLGLIDVLPAEDWWLRVPAERAAGAFPDAAFLQLQIPTLTDPTLAPRGHVVSGFMPHVAPRLAQGSWSGRRAELAELLLARIETAVPNLRDALVDYILFTPEDLESRVGLTDGNIRHLAHLPGQAFDSRPVQGWSDGSTPVRGLFLCGAGIHPGGEVSGANGRNAARTVLASASQPGTEA